MVLPIRASQVEAPRDVYLVLIAHEAREMFIEEWLCLDDPPYSDQL